MNALRYTCDGGVGSIVMNAPPANSYGISFICEMRSAIQTALDDAMCKVVIVRSELPGFFCGGADIKQFKANDPDKNEEMIALAHEVLSKPSRSEKIFIAEISGHALGGGLEIAMACDLCFAAKGEYRLGLPEVTLGLLPGNGGTQRLTSRVGISKSIELMITGERFSPQEAYDLGIVNRLFDAIDLRKETQLYAEMLSKSATLAVGKIKRSIYDGQSFEAGLAAERQNISVLFASSDAAEGFSAFTERRKPEFTGK